MFRYRSAGRMRLLLTLAMLLKTAELSAAEPDPIVRIEEDWIAYVRNPEADLTAPQIVNVMAPQASTDGVFGMFELNHASQPNFRSGGFQVQSWIGESLHDFTHSLETAPLRSTYDKLTYTVMMELDGQKLNFTLKDGRSKTWGKFAQIGVTACTPSVGLNLESYSPQFSVDNTSINVGAHRVELMYQSEVRYYSATELVTTDTTPRLLHRYAEIIQYVSLQEYEQNSDYYNIEITE